MRPIPTLSATRRPQSGAVLIVAMIMLLVLTLLGITAMGTASLEELMAGNEQETLRAFQAVESTLATALHTNITALGTDSSALVEDATKTLQGTGNSTAGGYYSIRYMQSTSVKGTSVERMTGVGSGNAYHYRLTGNAYSNVPAKNGKADLTDADNDGEPDNPPAPATSAHTKVVGGMFIIGT